MPTVPTPVTLRPGLTLLLAAACGLIVANLYYAQPLLGPIADDIGLSRAAAGLVVTLTQCGYGLGLLLIVPLSDRIENRRLIALALVGTAVSAAVAGLSRQPAVFLAACSAIGLSAVAAQVIVPYASYLAPESERGRVTGNIVSGLLLGIMLARPLASLLADLWGWHSVFLLSAAATLAMAGWLYAVLPPRQPPSPPPYAALLRSMWTLWRDTPVLRLRGFYQGCAFAAFSVFWSAVPLHLASTFGLSQSGIALYALVGVAGAIAAPVTGRLADRGWSDALTPAAMLLAAGAFALTLLWPAGSPGALAALVAAAVVLDMGVAASLLLGQRAIFVLGAESRGRLNGLFIATFFVGGAIGSMLGTWAYASGGWPRAALVGLALPLGSLLGWLFLRNRSRAVAAPT